jgi:hypothetical protein
MANTQRQTQPGPCPAREFREIDSIVPILIKSLPTLISQHNRLPKELRQLRQSILKLVSRYLARAIAVYPSEKPYDARLLRFQASQDAQTRVIWVKRMRILHQMLAIAFFASCAVGTCRYEAALNIIVGCRMRWRHIRAAALDVKHTCWT